ncbi:MAG: NAD-binding protein [Acidiferrobacterales bacterium]|nr:NAD-binding protein [Acidiferrobacterales bacterium]
MQQIPFLIMRRMRTPLIVLICAYAIAVLGFVLIPGQDDQGQPWRMSFFHAFYFVSYMGSTIGFGEIPYPFTGGQRLWTLVTIYTTVIAWLYAIGTLISLMQTPLFRSAVTRNSFVRRVKKIREPFYLVCGYGDTGHALVSALAELDKQCVVVDLSSDRLDELELEELPKYMPALQGDASESDVLLDAGLASAFCHGVIAITRDDQVNLKIAIASKLLNKDVRVFCWAESHDTGANMASFGTEHIIYPYDTFANYLSNAISLPSNYLLHQWLTAPRGTLLTEPVFPPRGNWILCGYGRFGKAVYQKLIEQGLSVTVIAEDHSECQPPANSVEGRGTEESTLNEANIRDAVGIIAGTDHDVNNLSIILTAKVLNPGIFTIGRQEYATNNLVFSAANLDIVTNHSKLISSEVLALINTPLTNDFLLMSRHQSDDWSRDIVARLLGCVDDENPSAWVITIRPKRTSAISQAMENGQEVQVNHIIRSPNHRKKKLPCVPLLLARAGEKILLPDPATVLQPYDRILFAGNPEAKRSTDAIGTSPDLLHYMLTGENRARGEVWNWFAKSMKSKS